MKINKLLYFSFWVLGVQTSTIAQTEVANPIRYAEAQASNEYVFPIDKLAIKGSYPLAISAIKTIHIVFPREIKEVDAGSADILAQVTSSFSNVLKIKAAAAKPFVETNLTVLTADGGLFSFLVSYDPQPELLAISISNNATSDKLKNNQLGIGANQKSEFLLADLTVSQNEIESTDQKVNELSPSIKGVGAEALTIKSRLVGIYMNKDLVYLGIEINNASFIDYPIEFIKVNLKDKKKFKRMASQEEEVKITQIYPVPTKVLPQKTSNFSIIFPFQTLPPNKILQIEIYEKNGGRHLQIEILPNDFKRAKQI